MQTHVALFWGRKRSINEWIYNTTKKRQRRNFHRKRKWPHDFLFLVVFFHNMEFLHAINLFKKFLKCIYQWEVNIINDFFYYPFRWDIKLFKNWRICQLSTALYIYFFILLANQQFIMQIITRGEKNQVSCIINCLLWWSQG